MSIVVRRRRRAFNGLDGVERNEVKVSDVALLLLTAAVFAVLYAVVRGGERL